MYTCIVSRALGIGKHAESTHILCGWVTLMLHIWGAILHPSKIIELLIYCLQTLQALLWEMYTTFNKPKSPLLLGYIVAFYISTHTYTIIMASKIINM